MPDWHVSIAGKPRVMGSYPPNLHFFDWPFICKIRIIFHKIPGVLWKKECTQNIFKISTDIWFPSLQFFTIFCPQVGEREKQQRKWDWTSGEEQQTCVQLSLNNTWEWACPHFSSRNPFERAERRGKKRHELFVNPHFFKKNCLNWGKITLLWTDIVISPLYERNGSRTNKVSYKIKNDRWVLHTLKPRWTNSDTYLPSR